MQKSDSEIIKLIFFSPKLSTRLRRSFSYQSSVKFNYVENIHCAIKAVDFAIEAARYEAISAIAGIIRKKSQQSTEKGILIKLFHQSSRAFMCINARLPFPSQANEIFMSRGGIAILKSLLLRCEQRDSRRNCISIRWSYAASCEAYHGDEDNAALVVASWSVFGLESMLFDVIPWQGSTIYMTPLMVYIESAHVSDKRNSWTRKAFESLWHFPMFATRLQSTRHI